MRKSSRNFKRWQADGDRHCWTPPKGAAWPFRLPVIRHARALLLVCKEERRRSPIRSLGVAPSEYPEWVVYAIARGWF